MRQVTRRAIRRFGEFRETLEIVGRSLRRRYRTGGLGALLTTPPGGNRVVYVDAGLHREGLELGLVEGWLADRPERLLLGFEANPQHFQVVSRRFGSRALVVGEALVGPGHGATATLHLDGGTGVGDSLLRRSAAASVTVPAARLSDRLRRVGYSADRDILLLRMNIEGAEPFVLADLAETGILANVDGFYGRWDDPAKIDRKLAAEMDEMIARHGLVRLPFNNKDLRSRLRRWAVRYDLDTSILAGNARIARRRVGG